jgi:nardilysin
LWFHDICTQQLKAIENIGIPTFVATISSILETIGVEGLYHGNVDVTDAERAQREIMVLLQQGVNGGGLPRKKYPHQFVLQLPQSSTTLRCPAKDPTDPNTAVEVYFQVGKDRTIDRVMADLLMEMMYEPLYDQIRTKDQFGYQVSCDSRWTNGVIGMRIQVVTSSKTAQQAEDRIELFLSDFRKTLADMSQAEFMEHLASLAKQKLDMFNSLSEETSHLWSEIRDGRYMWQVEREEVMFLKTITKEQALDAYDRWLSAGNSDRRRMAIHVISCEGPASEGRLDVDPEEIGGYNDGRVKAFHKYCKNQTFGKIY